MNRFIPLCLVFLTGCATHKPTCICLLDSKTEHAMEKGPKEIEDVRDPRDPFEPLNRVIFAMNTALDHTLFAPFIGFYRVMPPCLKNRIVGVMNTVEAPISIVNCLLQGKMHDFLAHTARLVFNTLFGLGGLFDVATALNICPPREDFGKTLKKMAFIPPGPFLIMPFLGPSTLRDAIGQAVDCAALPVTYWKDTVVAYYPASYLMTQSKITSIQQDISDTFSDTYSTVRNAYFMLRGDVAQVQSQKDTKPNAEKDRSMDPSDAGTKGAMDTEPDLLVDNSALDSSEESSPDLLGDFSEPDLLGDSDDAEAPTRESNMGKSVRSGGKDDRANSEESSPDLLGDSSEPDSLD
jgi:phospholipid-binding lipoprotein MlaA